MPNAQEPKFKFTDKAIRDLVPTDQRTEYADTEITGLRLRVSKTGIKTFSLLRRIRNGPMERLTLGRFDDIKCEQARTKATQLIGLIAGRANPAEIVRAHKGEPTFAELFAEYLERHAKLKKRTWREDEQKYRDYLEKDLGKKKITHISRLDLAAIHSKITKAGSPILANRVKDLVSSVFGRAVKWGYLDTNPAKGIEDNPEKSRERFLQPGELPRLFAALADEPNSHFRDFFLLALLTGARRANVRCMKWADLDLDSGVWRIPGVVSKNGEPLDVPLVPEAIEILKQRKPADEAEKSTAKAKPVFVFPAQRSDSTLGHLSGERRAWLRILSRAGLDNVRIHDLRRTMGSWQARTGASMVIIGKSLGHKSQQATAVYARLDLDPVRQSMQTAASAMLEAGGFKATAEVVDIKGKRAA
jgi:integrase